MTQITMMVWSLTQSKTLECEVKWVVGSITTNKTSGGDGISAELFQILRDDMPENLENSAMATGLEKVSFHSNPKKGQCQRTFKLPYNCAHFTCQDGNAQNLLSQASVGHEPRTSRCTSWVQKRQRNQRSNCQHTLDHRESKRIPEKHSKCFTDYTKVFHCVDHNKLWKILKRDGIRQTILPIS